MALIFEKGLVHAFLFLSNLFLFLSTCLNCTQLPHQYRTFMLRMESRVSAPLATVQQAVFLGYLDISLLVRSLRFCTLPHILSKKSIRAIVAVVRRQYECNQCQFSNRLQSFRRGVTLRKHTKILVWSEKSPYSRERVSETSCKSVYKKRNVTHWWY